MENNSTAAVRKYRFHYAAHYIINPQHRITVDVVGLGGTGSQVLTALARMNAALVKLDHPGLHVRGWDPDTVSEANMGRQIFFEPEVGMNKAVALMSRINRAFGTDWEARPEFFGTFPEKGVDRNYVNYLKARPTSNITISCVDTIKARMEIGSRLKPFANKGVTGDVNLRTPYYWLDFGNAQKTGQVVLGTLKACQQPEPSPEIEAVAELPHVLQVFPDLKSQKEEDSGPSCSLAEALTKQDLFINSTLCQLGMAILWKLFREYRIQHHGAFLNLDTLSVNPINV